MARLVFNYILFFSYLIFLFHKTALCSVDKSYFNIHSFNSESKKKYYLSFFDKKKIKTCSEVSKNLFQNNNNSKYQMYFHTQYNLNIDNFLFLKYIMLKGHHNYSILKNIFFMGYGHNVFNGPVHSFHIECSPSMYYNYTKNINMKNSRKILFYSSGIYSYQLINNIYYSHCFTTLNNFQHCIIKIENALNIFVKNDVLFLKCSYNVIFNENELHVSLPNINKYISFSISYLL